MSRTPKTALRAAIVVAVMAVLPMLAAGAPTASAATATAACANKYCSKDLPGVPSCMSRSGYRAIARCYVDRAARHFGQSRYTARRVAWCESRYKWWAVNGGGYTGLYQFGRPLWSRTPYHAKSRKSPRYAALAAMWVWKRGGQHNWSCY
jgi:hypothetical protein